MSTKLFEDPRSLYQQRVNDILKGEANSSEVFEYVFKLHQLFISESPNVKAKNDPDAWKVFLEIFSSLGVSTFTKLISIVKGKTITLPSPEELEDSITTVLCYYFKELNGLDWKAIKDKLGNPRLNTIKYGIKVRQLKSFIDSQTVGRARLPSITD